MSNPTIFSSFSTCDMLSSIPIYAISGMITGKLCNVLPPTGGAIFGITYMTTQIIFSNLCKNRQEDSVPSLAEKVGSFIIPYFTSILSTCLITSSLGHSISFSSSILTSAAINIVATALSITISILFVAILQISTKEGRGSEVTTLA